MNNNRYDDFCMSWLNSNNKDIRCTRKVCKESDFCQYHKRYSKYMPNIIKNKNINYQELDDKFPETLLGIYESWKDISEIYWIELNKKWWDIRILLNMFANQLISSEMENPKPMYPHDPFTRRNFTPIELEKIKNKCKELKLNIYIGLAKFLESNINDIFIQEYGTSSKMSNFINDNLSKYLRYKIVNFKNSQNCYIGFWVNKCVPLSSFEKMYKLYNSLPFQIYVMHIHGPIITDNINKINIKNIIESLEEENIDLNSGDVLCIL